MHTLCAHRLQLSPQSALVALFIAISGFLSAACHEALASSTQVIGQVGNADITTEELESEFRSENISIDQRQNPEIIKRVLNNIVLRKYLAQQALAAKLDREPNVLLNILRAREQTLATAIIRHRVLDSLAGQSVDEYIRAHPLEFAERKAFKVDQISLPLDETTRPAVEAAKHLATLEAIEQKLKQASVLYSYSQGTFNSDDIPEEIVKGIGTHTADVFFIHSGATATFFKVVGVENAPLTPQQSAALARHLLERQVFDEEVRQATLEAQAQASFEGEYAKIMGQPKPAKERTSIKGGFFANIWTDDMAHIVVSLIVGFTLGYGIREFQSRRHRAIARKRGYS